jgi:hypothetical protein
MKVDFKGAKIEGVSFTLSKSSHMYNARFIRCYFDDEEAVYPFSTNCIFEDCTIRSQTEVNIERFNNKG